MKWITKFKTIKINLLGVSLIVPELIQLSVDRSVIQSASQSGIGIQLVSKSIDRLNFRRSVS